MLSGNGRHRRPRQAPALVVAAGVTGSAIAIPLLGATGASAADATTWDRVAGCETGASWSENTGDGYYGGLHVTQWDWENYGGLEYAPSADQASRSQQIAAAERILDGRGVAAWPTCGPLAGLSKDSAPADVDTGVAADSPSTSTSTSPPSSVAPSPKSTGTSDSTDLSGSSTPSPSTPPSSDTTDSTTKSDESDVEVDADPNGVDSSDADSSDADSNAVNGDDSDKSTPEEGSSGTSEGATTGAGRHRGDTAAEGATDGRTDSAAGRHASRDSDAAREVVDGSYIVRVGDSLAAIADALGLEGGWAELYGENKQTVGADADLILPGQSLAVGAEPGEK